MKILFTGGGSAGHVTPNVALIEQSLKEGRECLYVGSRAGIETEIIKPLNIPYHAISSGKLRRYFDWQNFVDPFLIIYGIIQSLFICLRHKPDVVFSKGGFVAVPVVFAAWLVRIPVICHESDITPGLANKICFPFARFICVNFEQTTQYLSKKYLLVGKVKVTGTPVRASLLEGESLRGRQSLSIDSDKPLLLVFGGSLGAKVINEQVRRVLNNLTETFALVHVTGAGNVDQSLDSVPGYLQVEFMANEFGDVLAAADVVVARAGANSIYELLLTRKPHILIPLTAAASRGDQLVNARIFSEAGYSRVIDEAALNDELFLMEIEDVYMNREKISRKLEEFVIQDSTQVIVDLIKKTAAGEIE
jgi:UDP-N-acetylglucosamine--N-acetylmuramyl-(pentapeptide) pyrophosphoryl-undecaprenol N-acetylglucosamine transferase